MESGPENSQSGSAKLLAALEAIKPIPALNLFKRQSYVREIEQQLLHNDGNTGYGVVNWVRQLSDLHTALDATTLDTDDSESLATIFYKISDITELQDWYDKLMQSRSLLNDFDTIQEEYFDTIREKYITSSLKKKVGNIANTLEVISEVIRDRLEKLQPTLLLLNLININNTKQVRDEDLEKIFLEFDRIARKDNLKDVNLFFDSELSDSTKYCIYLVREATRVMEPDCEYKKKLLRVMDSYLKSVKFTLTSKIVDHPSFMSDTLTPLFKKGVVGSCCDALQNAYIQEKNQDIQSKLVNIEGIISALTDNAFSSLNPRVNQYKGAIAFALAPYIEKRLKEKTWFGFFRIFTDSGLGRLDAFLTALDDADSLEKIRAAFMIMAEGGAKSWEALAPISRALNEEIRNEKRTKNQIGKT